MKQGQYILDRWMVGLIRDICIELGIDFRSYSDDWILELNRNTDLHRIIGYKFDINNSVASTIAGDKVACYQILQQHGVPAVEHRLIRTKAGQYDDWAMDLDQVVVKPLDGTSGHAVARLDSSEEVSEYMALNPHIAAWAVSPFVNIESERRCIVLDGAVICQYEKAPVDTNGLKMFNLGLGAKAVLSQATEQETNLALEAMQATGLRLAAVDVIKADGTYRILEINDGIMMENFMRQSSDNKTYAKEVYRQIIKKLFKT